MHLRKEDTVCRHAPCPHHFAIAKGVDLNKLAAEIFGKATGLGKGKGGHMHLIDPRTSSVAAALSGPASRPPARALAAKKLGKDWVAVAFAGEGAANQGLSTRRSTWPRSGNCRWSLSSRTTRGPSRSPSRPPPPSPTTAAAWPTASPACVDENDVLAVYEVVGEAVARASGAAKAPA